MTTISPLAEPAASPPRRRLRKRWIVLALFVALPLLGSWLIFREQPLAVMRLPDGRTFTIHKLTYGIEHRYRTDGAALTPVELWLNRWLARIGRQIQASFSGGGFNTGGNESVALWHSFDWAKKAPETTPSHIVLTDSHGWRTALDTTHLQTTPQPVSVPGQPYTPAWISGSLVSPSPTLQVQLLNAQGKELAATQVPYDVPKSLRQMWKAQSLPVTESDGNFSVTLKGLHASWTKLETDKPTISDMLAITFDYAVTVDGTDSPSWGVMTGGVPYFEMTTAGATVQSPQGWNSPINFCTVSPYEALWKLRLPLICQNPDEVPTTGRVSLGRTKFDKTQPTETMAQEAIPAGEAKVQLLGVGRAGSFNYEGAGEAQYQIPSAFPIDWATRKQLQGTFQMTTAHTGNYTISYGVSPPPGSRVRPPQLPMTVTLKFTAPRPHVVISVDKSSDRFPYLIVKDENGRLLEGELFNFQGLLVWLAKEAYDDVQEADVTLLLQKPRDFTFVVPPPAVPPRPTTRSQ